MNPKCNNCFCSKLSFQCPAQFLPHPAFCWNADPDNQYHNPSKGDKVRAMCLEYKVPENNNVKVDLITKKITYKLNINPNKINLGLILKDISYVEKIKSTLEGNNINEFINLAAICAPEGVEFGFDGNGYEVIRGEDGIQSIHDACNIVGYVGYTPEKYDGVIQFVVSDDTNGDFDIISFAKYNSTYSKYLLTLCKKYKLFSTDENSLWTKMKNLGGALINVATNAVVGNYTNVDDNTYQERLKICHSCPLLDPENKSCSVCGCKVALRTRLAAMSCPDNPPRWEAVSEKKGSGCGCSK